MTNKLILIISIVLFSISANAQRNASMEKKLSAISHLIVADSLDVTIKQGNRNSIVVEGEAEAVKNFVIKQKAGTLTIYQNTRAQVFVTPEPINIEKNINFSKIEITIASRPENITISNGAKVTIDGEYNPKRLIVKIDKNSTLNGTINCEAFGLFMKTGAEATLSGKYRSTKITVDSSLAVFNSYQAENSELSVTGGSQLTITGNTSRLKLTVAGYSRLEALNMTALYCDATVEGHSDAFFKVTESLNLKGRDKSHIIVTGAPKATTDVSPDCKYGRR